jgi:hypothetical protein
MRSRRRLVRKPKGKVVLTNCPSCLSGLGRNESLGFKARHLAEALALSCGWRKLAGCEAWAGGSAPEVVTF